MGDVLTNAERILAEAERLHALALGEKDKQRQRVALAVADHYYRLHDRLLELQRLDSWRAVMPVPANSPDVASVHSAQPALEGTGELARLTILPFAKRMRS
jgi:hypothetical protein